MLEFITFDGLQSDIRDELLKSYERDPETVVRMVGLLFARPELEVTDKEVLRCLPHYHRRSGEHMNIYCAGYGAWVPEDQVLDQVPIVHSPRDNNQYPWTFSVGRFNDVVEAIEERTAWRYPGGAWLFLVNAIYSPADDSAHLDFDTALAVDVQMVKEHKLILSVDHLFGELFNFARDRRGNDPTWGFRMKFVGGRAWTPLKHVVIGLLSTSWGEGAKKAADILQVALKEVGKARSQK